MIFIFTLDGCAYGMYYIVRAEDRDDAAQKVVNYFNAHPSHKVDTWQFTGDKLSILCKTDQEDLIHAGPFVYTCVEMREDFVVLIG